MDIWKANVFNSLKEDVEELTNSWSPTLVNERRSPSYLKQKTFKYCL